MTGTSTCCHSGSRFYSSIRWYILMIPAICTFLFNCKEIKAQGGSFFKADTVYHVSRGRLVAIGTAGVYSASMLGLYHLWYKDYPLVGLHSFNDNSEWLQMDKIGHIGSAYYVGKIGIGLCKWTGMKKNKAIWYGGLIGAFFQTSIEVFDGLSPAWGFSWGDVTANLLGSALLISQELVWNEQKIQFKYSFHQTKYARLRPDLLGNSLLENMFKDYNGQTYWLSVNIASLLPSGNSFPKWLSISAGYGAEGMVDDTEILPEYPYSRYRQFYLAPDIDLSRIRTRSGLFNSILYAFGFVKFPMPSLMLEVPGKFRFKPLAF